MRECHGTQVDCKILSEGVQNHRGVCGTRMILDASNKGEIRCWLDRWNKAESHEVRLQGTVATLFRTFI